jgi:hypothetical protein
VNRLASEASKSASHVLSMCIRALDYLPPVDVTFFEFLRALITADADVVQDDRFNYRVAFVESFRRRGIYPLNLQGAPEGTLRTLSVDTLRWQGLSTSEFPADVQSLYGEIVTGLKEYVDACLYIKNRETLFALTREHREKLHGKLSEAFAGVPEFATELGVDPTRSFEVHELRRASRVSPDGRHVPQLVVALTQTRQIGEDGQDSPSGFTFRGGATLIVDLTVPEVKYRIVKNVDSKGRQARTASFTKAAATDPLRALFFGPDRKEPFAALHSLADRTTE